jgi:hypothetical protein
MRVSLCCSILLLAANTASAQTVGRAVTTSDITAKDLRLRLFLIADDSMGGREPGSIGNFKTAEYIASEFKRLGLKPGGEGGSYFQQVPFVHEQLDSQAILRGDGGGWRRRDVLFRPWIPSRPGPWQGEGRNLRRKRGGFGQLDRQRKGSGGRYLVVLDVQPGPKATAIRPHRE